MQMYNIGNHILDDFERGAMNLNYIIIPAVAPCT